MQIWFCQSCGAQVIEKDLRHVPGLTAKSLVYCKDCIKKETRADKILTAPTKRPTRKSGHATAPASVPNPEPPSEHPRASSYGIRKPAPMPKSLIAAGFGIVLLTAGVLV